MALYKWETLLAGSGAWFCPENEGETGQVLKKTETWYAYCCINDVPNWWTTWQVLTKTNDWYDWWNTNCQSIEQYLRSHTFTKVSRKGTVTKNWYVRVKWCYYDSSPAIIVNWIQVAASRWNNGYSFWTTPYRVYVWDRLTTCGSCWTFELYEQNN